MASDPLPLFPLNTVLFPRMPLRLNIFEERYRLMIGRCLEEKRPFGVVLIRDGSEVGPSAVPEMVGTLARILAVKKIPDGKMQLLAEGTRRFRLLDYAADAEPYLVGIPEPLADGETDSAITVDLVDETTGLFHEYFNELVSHAGVQMPSYELPSDPEEFSFVLAAVLQAEPRVRQDLLELTDTIERLIRERSMLQSDLKRIRTLATYRAVKAERVPAEKGKPYFSPN
jgi:Lon protease-like protein